VGQPAEKGDSLHTSVGLSHQAGPTAFADTLLVDFLETEAELGCPVAGV
jgi:hypothetical protein